MNYTGRSSGVVAQVMGLSLAYSLCMSVVGWLPAQAQTAPAASPLAGGAAPNPRAVSLYNLGLTAYKQGSPESAIIFFKRACDIDPNLSDAQYNLGVIFQLQKRYKDAQPRFEEVLRTKPNDPDAHYQLGLIFQETNHPVEARQHLSTIAPNNGHYQDAQRHLAQLNNVAGAAESQPPADTGMRDAAAANPYNNSGVYGQAPQTAPLQQQQQAYVPPQQQAPITQAPSYSTPTYTPPQTQAPVQQVVQQPVQTPAYTPVAQAPQAVQTPATPSYPAAAPPGTPSTDGPIPKAANSTLRIIATGFSAPSGLAFDRIGNLYVANYMTNSIDRINSDGTRTTFCSGATIRGPIGLISDDSNNIFVANYNGGTVVKISPAGVSTVIASGFKRPYYLTLDKEGNLYVSQQEDNSIVRINLPRAVGSR